MTGHETHGDGNGGATIQWDLSERGSMPFRTVAAMVLAAVRRRIGRSAVTLVGVALGTAFLMAAGTGGILDRHFAAEEVDRVAAATAATNVETALGTLDGRTLAIWIERLGPRAEGMLEILRDMGATRFQIFAPVEVQRIPVEERVSSRVAALAGASALIICNEGGTAAVKLPEETADLGEGIVMDLADALDGAILEGWGLRHRHLLGEGEGAGLGDFSGLGLTPSADGGGRRTWLIIISLLVSGIGIANALLMSVTERFREIGTLKCLGSSNRLIVQMFLIESAVLGFAGALLGAVLGWVVECTEAATRYGWTVVWSNLPWSPMAGFGGVCLAVGAVVAMVAAVYPAIVASRMMPADALRTDV